MPRPHIVIFGELYHKMWDLRLTPEPFFQAHAGKKLYLMVALVIGFALVARLVFAAVHSIRLLILP